MGKIGRLKTPLRALLAFVVAAGLLTIALPFQAQAVNSAPSSMSISVISDACALLPATFTTGSKLSAIRTNKKSARGICARQDHNAGYFASFGDSLPGDPQFRSTSPFNGFLKKIHVQACLSLDLPPPSA